jgi:hypothetical protein
MGFLKMRPKEISEFLFLGSINKIDTLKKDTNIFKRKDRGITERNNNLIEGFIKKLVV